MDELDRNLLVLLRQNARTPAAALAKTLKVSRATVQNRIDRMRDRGDIFGFTLRGPAEGTEGQVRAIMSIAVEGRKGESAARAPAAFPRSRRFTRPMAAGTSSPNSRPATSAGSAASSTRSA